MLKNQTKHLFDQDVSLERSFIAWLDAYAQNDQEWNLIYDQVHTLLSKEPELADGFDWPEISLVATTAYKPF
jgi:hypothetical protein